MKKLRHGQKVRCSAMNEFKGDDMKYEGKVVGKYRKIREPWLKRPIPETIPKSELIPAKKNASGVDTYWRFINRVQDWAKVLGQLSPVLAVILAYLTKKKKTKASGSQDALASLNMWVAC